MSPDPYWERPSVVEKFASREPDQRLLELLDQLDGEGPPRVLDVGCAGGRNTELLIERGCDTWAVDRSRAMVERTAARVAARLGASEAARRVRVGGIEELGQIFDGPFDWMIALGVLHMATHRAAWDRALAQIKGLIAPGGLLLVAIFTPRTDLTGEGIRPVPGEPHIYDGFPSGRAMVLEAPDLDGELARAGFAPEVPSETVEVKTDKGRRVTVNALYRRAAAAR